MRYYDFITGEEKEILTAKKNPSKYQLMKAAIRESAQEYLESFNYYCYSYGELAYYSAIFERLGKRYGLIREFRENGVI